MMCNPEAEDLKAAVLALVYSDQTIEHFQSEPLTTSILHYTC